MAGHSHFANIQHKKGARDAKRAKIFTKLAREITVAAKLGQPDPVYNARLKAAIAAAKADSMPKDNIERAIKKATGADQENYDEARYEGIAPGSVSLIVEALTNNRNRTAAELRTIFDKNGGTMGTTNSVAFNFQRVGQIAYKYEAGSEDAVMEAAIEAGADDVVSDKASGHIIYCAPDALHTVAKAIEEKLGEPEAARLDWRPTTTVDVPLDKAQDVLDLIAALEDNDDVQRVSANYEMSDEVMAKLSG
jgi:YebC/PmpR family DNA-binding regulatory protein